MDIGYGLLTVSIACSVASAVFSLPAISRRLARGDAPAKAMVAASFVVTTGAFALLAWASLSSEFTYRYVWEHSSTDLGLVYKLSAIWAGGGGSLLLCTWLMSAVLVVEWLALVPRRGTGTSFRSGFAATMSLLVGFFSFTTLVSGVFDRTDAMVLAAYPDGRGLDVLLQTPEMVVHAPLIFGAYAALSALFAASVSHLLSGDSAWLRTGLRWARLAWLLLTAGIGLGAVWAYYVIGWGGYWSWDPVETASLIPWFMVTTFLHARQRLGRGNEYKVAAPMFGMMAFIGVVFVSFVVRAGGLWSSSVHDYGSATDVSGVSRLTSLLADEPSLAGTFSFMMLLLAVASSLTVRAIRRAGPPPLSGAPPRLSGYVNDQNNMLLTVTVLALAALLALALMAKTVDSDAPSTFAELDQKMTIVFVALMMSLGLCVGWRLVGQERASILALAVLGSSVALGSVGAYSGSFDGTVGLALPSFVFAVSASAVRLAQALLKGSARRRAYSAGAQLVHVGLALVLMSYVVSTNTQSYPSLGGEVALGLGAQVSVDDYVVTLTGLEVSDEVSRYPSGVDQVRSALVDIHEDGRLIADDARLEVLYSYSAVSGYTVLERVAYVDTSLSEDLYLSFEWMTDDTALIHAKVVPMMAPLWAGFALLLVGLAVRLWSFQEPSSGGAQGS